MAVSPDVGVIHRKGSGSPLNKTYQLHVKLDGRWQWLCDIEAESHSDAFRQAVLCLKPEHYDKPIRLEQVMGAGERKPTRG